jgi:hypothetical protein
LFQNARSGAIFLFVDSYNSRAYKWFDYLVDTYNNYHRFAGNIRFLSRVDEQDLNIGERKEDLGRFFKKFGNISHPMVQGTFRYRICRKD